MSTGTIKSRRTIKRYGLGLGVLAGLGVAAAYYPSPDVAASVRVITAPVTRGRVATEVSAIGTLQPVNTVQVGSQVSGRVAWLGADYNSVVRKGQLIARLEPSLLEAQVAQSQASLERALSEVERARVQLTDAEHKHQRATQLSAKGLIPQSDFDAATVALATAGAQVKSAEAQALQARAAHNQNQVSLSQTVITAPIDGIVIQRNVDVGQTVSASVSSPTLFSIAADLTAMRLSVGVDESDVANIRPKQPVTFRVETYPDERFQGEVKQVRLEPTVTQNVTTYAVIIEVPNRQLKLKPGMTAHATVEIAARHDAMRVPNAALRFRPTPAIFAALNQAPPPAPTLVVASYGDGEDEPLPAIYEETADRLFGSVTYPVREGQVWLYVDGELQPVAVRTGISDGQTTELLAGDLEEGVELVTNMSAGETEARPSAPTGGIFMNQPGNRTNANRRG